MKKYLFPALALGLVMTSCQSDEPFAPGEGGEKQVTFTLNVPGELGTRADFGANKSGVSGVSNEGPANIKYTLVLDANGDKKILDNDDATINGKTATFSPTVVLGREYKITAYASLDDAWDGENAIDITKHFNDETKDAYFYTTTHNFAEGDLQPLALKRPFGKLRLLATDYKLDNSGVLNTAVKNVKITYNDAQAAEFDVFNSVFEFGGNFVNVDAQTFGYYGAEEDGAMPIFADYVPANPGDNMVDFTVEVTYTNDETYSRTFNDIPVKRNALTTLKGAFFTAGAEITVNVEDNFENETLIDETVAVTTNQELQEALDNADNNTMICFAADIEGDVTAIQKPNVNVIINGCGFKYKNGAIIVHSNSNHYPSASLTIKNVNFETNIVKTGDDGYNYFNCVEAVENGSQRYSTNITVENCTFTATGVAERIAAGVQIKASKWAKVINCTATNMHSLVQAQSCDESVIVKGCTINGKNGVAFKQVKSAIVEGTTIVAAEYGIRFDGNVNNYGITVKDNNVTAKQPFIVRKMTGQNNTIALEGENTLTTDEVYQIVITKDSDDVAYVAPTGTYTLTGAEDYNVYPREIVVRTEEQLVSALKGLTTFNTLVKLIDDITITTDWDNRYRGAKISVPVRIDGQGHTLKFTGALTDPNYSSVFRFENDAEVKNLKIDLSEINARCRAISAKQNLVIDQCEFIGNANYNTRGIIYGEGQTNSQFDASITITNSKFTNWKRGLTDNENAKDVKNVVVKGTIFSNAPVYISAYETITFVNNTMDNTWVNITSYTSPETLKVNAIGNSLDKDYSQYNVIGSSSKKFSATNVEAQNGFTVFYAE